MMSKDFLKRGIILPLVTTVVVAALSVAIIAADSANVSPIESGADVLKYDSEYAKGRTDFNYQSGDVIGTLSSKGELRAVYDAGYTTLESGCSLSDRGAFFGETGTGYVEIINSNADLFGDKLTFSGDVGTFEYRKTDEKELGSESEIFRIAPRAEQSVIVYYRQRADVGLSPSYNVIIYEGVA